MKEIMEYLKVRYCSEKGQGIVEYALILAFVVAIAIAITGTDGLQSKIETVFTNVGNQLAGK